ncbi:hypothetical protein [Vibrio vulnificus YJ016]|uniref:Uncharacterized protein n=1 Tax=Vibrio vulnificus (strain YJ016) TaxID=196600 RepID=Q7MI84_VIBVY|nr:hypothetical protein [Vibrio vulnificus YJ016]
MGDLLITRETVAMETPASRATSLIVAMCYLISMLPSLNL